MWHSGLLPESLTQSLSIRHRLIGAHLSIAAHLRNNTRASLRRNRHRSFFRSHHTGDRIKSAHIAIETLLRQTAAAERVILWISDKHSISGLPSPLQRQMHHELNIRFVPDIGPYTKIIYALRKFPEYAIVTVDDDSVYAAGSDRAPA